MSEACFRMKGTTLTSVMLEVAEFNGSRFAAQLSEKVASAPQFFQRTPVILNLGTALSTDDFTDLVSLCRAQQLQPMAVKGEIAGLKDIIWQLGLADISHNKVHESALDAPSESPAPAPQEAESTASVKPSAPSSAPKVIHRPIRSGQQVYSEGDLIILAPVSEGAEILADGNIHVYNTLRGRALAGVKGNTGARIFCQQLEAELLSVAGRFVLQDSIQGTCWKKPAQAFLEDDTLLVEPLADRQP